MIDPSVAMRELPYPLRELDRIDSAAHAEPEHAVPHNGLLAIRGRERS
jgi:hypothetical protein